MSLWTHIDGFINFNNLVSYGHIYDFLGPQITSQSNKRLKDAATLPLGSEGSLRYDIKPITNPGYGQTEVSAVTVGLSGDLRDFDNLSTIKTWLDSIPKAFVESMFVKDSYTESDAEIFNDYIRNSVIIASTSNEEKTWRWSAKDLEFKEITNV